MEVSHGWVPVNTHSTPVLTSVRKLWVPRPQNDRDSTNDEPNSLHGTLKSGTCTRKHYRIDATTSTLQRETGEPTFVVPSPSGCKEISRKGSKEHFVRSSCKIRGIVREERRTPRQDSTPCSQRHTGHRESNLHTKKIHRVDCGIYIDAALREIYDACKAAVQHHETRDGGLADRTREDTTITKRRLDLVARMMLEQVSLLSNGDYKQSTMLRLHLGCVGRAAGSITASALNREQPMHSEDNQTLSSRAVGLFAYGSVWTTTDDGCNSCCHGEVW